MQTGKPSAEPNRNFNSPEYRYGFQGQEKDSELKGEGNSINYKYRMHDPRIGRFFAVDPQTASYPHYTPYSFSGNRVIAAVELEGLEEAWLFDPVQRKSLVDTAVKLEPQGTTTFHYDLYASVIKSAFDQKLPLKLIDHYREQMGTPLNINVAEMKAVNPHPVSIKKGVKFDKNKGEEERFDKALSSLKIGESGEFDFSVSGQSRTHGTLGEFTMEFTGTLTKGKVNDEWFFEGVMTFKDTWDFDKKEDGQRSEDSEVFTKIGRKYLSGQGFPIRSEGIPVRQTSKDFQVDWWSKNDFKDAPSPFVKWLEENPNVKKEIFEYIKDTKEDE